MVYWKDTGKKIECPKIFTRVSLVAQLVNNSPAIQETLIQFWVGMIPWRRDRLPTPVFMGFCGSPVGKESACKVRDLEGFDPWVGKIPWRKAWQPTLIFLPGESSWTEEPRGLQFMGLWRLRHNWTTKHRCLSLVSCGDIK